MDVIGLFDRNLIAAEDYDLHNRFLAAGLRIGRIDSSEVHIGEPHTLKEVVVTHFGYGRSIDLYVRKYSWFSLKQLGPLRRAYIRHYRGFLLYQYVRYASAIAGYISSKL
jgi:hypothetical protein